MISNIPAFAVHQDYQARHSDMLAAARRGKDAEVVLRSGLQPYPEKLYFGGRSGGGKKARLHAEKVAGEWRLKWLTADSFPVDKSPGNGQP